MNLFFFPGSKIILCGFFLFIKPVATISLGMGFRLNVGLDLAKWITSPKIYSLPPKDNCNVKALIQLAWSPKWELRLHSLPRRGRSPASADGVGGRGQPSTVPRSTTHRALRVGAQLSTGHNNPAFLTWGAELSLGRNLCILSVGPVLSFPEGVALSKDTLPTLLCEDVCFHSPQFWTRGRVMQNRLQWVVSAFMHLLQFLVKEALKKKKKQIQMKQREQKGRVGKQSV